MEDKIKVRKNCTPEEQERRTKMRELPQASNVNSMDDIQNLFKGILAEFMKNGLDGELSCAASTTIVTRTPATAGTSTAARTQRTGFGDADVAVPRDRKGGSTAVFLPLGECARYDFSSFNASNRALSGRTGAFPGNHDLTVQCNDQWTVALYYLYWLGFKLVFTKEL